MEPVSIVFNNSFQYVSSWTVIPYDWSIVKVYFNTYISHLASHTQSLTNM